MDEETEVKTGEFSFLVTKEELVSALPKGIHMRVNDEFVELFNDAMTGVDSDLVDTYRENMISYSSILEDGKFKIEDYLNAVRYVSFKLMGYTNRDSYKMTFPKRFKRLMAKYELLGFDTKFIWDHKISPHVVSYNKNGLVNKIMEQSMIPTHVLNQDMYQDALNVQAGLMRTARSEMVRSTAANSILTQLRPPETSKLEIDVSIKESDAIKDLREITQGLAIAQHNAIESGAASAHQIAESKIILEETIDAEIEETTNDV